ncbi:MAG: N-acetyltransferase [Alphaproteobacteria bacterium]|nr:MAG: N-acetyltransferase [Alphaproteobacteria bacterium]
MTIILETERLRLRECTADDTDFILSLYTDPAFIEFIGDRGVRTREDAAAYIENNITASYREHGFGFYVTELKADGRPVGICGIVQRPTLDDPDIGFAFLTGNTSQGYGYESAAAMMHYARERLGIGRIVAIVSPGNVRSEGLLNKLGLKREGLVQLAADAKPVQLFASNA